MKECNLLTRQNMDILAWTNFRLGGCCTYKMEVKTSLKPCLVFAKLWIIVAIKVSVTYNVTAKCTKPSLGSNSYTLSEDKLLYNVNETYEIFCAPGYITSGTTTLVCQAGGSWSPNSPTCTNAEGSYPWWMLLVAVLLVVLLVSCILPRLIQYCCMKKNKTKKPDEERNNLQRPEEDLAHGSDYADNLARSMSPVPNFGKDRKSNIDYMTDIQKDSNLPDIKRANKNTRF